MIEEKGVGAQWPPRRFLDGGRVLVCEPLVTGSFFRLVFFSLFLYLNDQAATRQQPLPLPTAFKLHHH